jgi:hypothetical protein
VARLRCRSWQALRCCCAISKWQAIEQYEYAAQVRKEEHAHYPAMYLVVSAAVPFWTLLLLASALSTATAAAVLDCCSAELPLLVACNT